MLGVEPHNTTFFSCGAAAQRGLWPPHSHGFLDHTHDAPQSVGLLWTSDQSVAQTSTWQHTTLTTDIHAPGGIRTHNLSRRAAAELRFSSRGHWDWHIHVIQHTQPKNVVTSSSSIQLMRVLSFFRRKVKVKVKFTLATIHKGPEMEKMYSFTLSLTSARDRGGLSTPPPAALPSGERPGTHCTGGWVGLKVGLEGCGRSRLHRNSIPGPSSP
jgi:hypothetical protein